MTGRGLRSLAAPDSQCGAARRKAAAPHARRGPKVLGGTHHETITVRAGPPGGPHHPRGWPALPSGGPHHPRRWPALPAAPPAALPTPVPLRVAVPPVPDAHVRHGDRVSPCKSTISSSTSTPHPTSYGSSSGFGAPCPSRGTS